MGFYRTQRKCATDGEFMGLEQVEVAMQVEEEFSITLGDANSQTALTVGAFYDLVLRCVRQQSCPQPTDAEVWHRVVALSVAHGRGFSAERVTRETQFVADLGYG